MPPPWYGIRLWPVSNLPQDKREQVAGPGV
jgi:hypothetical protein